MKHSFFICLFIIYAGTLMAQFPSNSFGPKVDFSIGSNPQGLAMADLNNDGKLDVLAANITTGFVSIRLNTSNSGVINSSSFNSLITLTGYTSNPQQIFPSDLNHDGKIDLVVGYSSGTYFSIFLNNYDSGVFSSSNFTRIDVLAGNTPAGICVADLNNDGNRDIAVCNYVSNNIYVYRNITSNSTSVTLSNPVLFATGSGPNSIAAGDIDKDGFVDLVATNWNSNTVSVFRNTTTNVNTITFATTSHAVQTNPYWARIDNLDKDDFLEVICSNYGSGSVSVFDKTNVTGIAFHPRVDKNIGFSINVQASTINDFSGDFIKDIALTNSTSNGISVMKSKDTTGVITANYFSNPTLFITGSSPVGATSGDIDGDFRPDIIVGNYTSNSISVFKNYNIANEPTISASNLNVSVNLSSSEVTINLSKGNGYKRIIVARMSNTARVEPKDTSWYFGNDTFGLGSNVGLGNFVVFSDTGAIVKVVGLTVGQTYTFDIYEFNGYGGFCNYLTSSFASVTRTLGTVYYSKSTGVLNDTATWGVNPDGSGPSPSSFFNPNTTYIISNNSSPNINSNWIVTGTNSMVKVGNGMQPLNFSIPVSMNLFVDSIVVSSQATITILGGLISNKAFFDNLSNAQFISSAFQNIPGYSYFNLVIAGGVKNLSNNILVRNAFNMLTSINTGAFLITVGTSNLNPGILNRSNGTINGRLRRFFASSTNTGNSGLFPIGLNSVYRPIQVEHTTAPTNGGYLTAEFVNAPTGNSGLPIYDFSISPLIEINKVSNGGYWKLTAEGLTGGTYSLTATGTGFIGINTPANIRIVKRQPSGAWVTEGTALPGSGTTAVPVAGRTGLQGFGEFAFAGDSTDNVLPLSWHSFQVLPEENSNLLIWKTLNEINTHSFEVERKLDNEVAFSNIYTISSNNKITLNTYTYLDKPEVSAKKILYRIKQIDLDGAYTYSKVVGIDNTNLSDSYQFEISPNPASNIVYCSVCDIQTQVFDVFGKSILIDFDNGYANIEHFLPGLYFIKSGSKTVKLIKQ